jgi:Type II secretion system (T2SS), protein E, N-terminal domain
VDSDLGSLLLEVKAITATQLAQALSLRHKNGGLLLTHIITGGFISEDQVVNLFCTKRSYRRASEEDISQVPQEMLTYVPPHLAQRHAILPLSVEGDILYIAAADPSDTQVQAEVAYVTGHRVMPLVARYSVIMEAINKYYSKEAPLPPSFPPPYDPYADEPWQEPQKKVSADSDFFRAFDPNEKTNTLPGLGSSSPRGAPRFYVASRPPELGQPDQAPISFYAISDPNQDPTQRTLRGMGRDLDPTPTIQGSPQFFQGLVPPEEEETPTIRSYLPSQLETPAVQPTEAKATEGMAPKTRKIMKPLAPPRTIEALFPAPDSLIASIEKTSRVEDLLDQVFEYISYAFPRQAFLLNKPGLIQGFRGVSLPCEPSQLKVPLDSPSLFTSVLLSQFPYVGAITLTRSTKNFLRYLGYPCYAILIPINLGNRTVGIFLGDQGDPRRGADTPTFTQLRQLSTAVSQALLRILKKKRAEAVEKQLKLSEEEPSGKLF